MISDCTAFILAGGKSLRMGQDKWNVCLGGQAMLERVEAALQLVFEKTIVSMRQPHSEIHLQQILDNHIYTGPLAGLAACLEHSSTRWIFAIACDMPFISPSVIEYLAVQRADCQAVVPVVHGYPQPLAAFYSTSCLDEVRNTLNSKGKHSLRALLDRLRVRYVNEGQLLSADPQLRSFFDLDSPQDVIMAINEALK